MPNTPEINVWPDTGPFEDFSHVLVGLRVFSLAVLPVLIYLLHVRATRLRVTPEGLPWVGLRNEWFSKHRAHLRELFDSKLNIEWGYQQYGKHGKPYITPSLTFKAEVMLPPSYITWLLAQPDSVLSIQRVLLADVEFEYTSPRSWKFVRPFHVEALNKMNLNLMTGALIEEITGSVDEWFGAVAGAWRRVGVLASLSAILTRTTNRAFVGKQVAHNLDYMRCSARFVNKIGTCAAAIAYLIPAVLKPVLGPIAALPARYYDYRCSRHLVPLIRKHLGEGSASGGACHGERNPDMLQLMARFAAKSEDPLDHDPRSLCARILALSFVGIHTSSAAATAALVNILCAGPEVLASLRREAASVLRGSGGVWDRAAVGRLVLMDSTLRESLRFSAFKARGVERQVMRDVVLPDGTLLPEGTKVGMPTAEIHADPGFYADPAVFRHDRFVGRAELGMVNTTDTFLAFGHGRHACPGRFFSTHELKLLFAHIVLNYDFRFLDHRPRSIYLSDFCFIPEEVFFETRRRESSAHLDPEA